MNTAIAAGQPEAASSRFDLFCQHLAASLGWRVLVPGDTETGSGAGPVAHVPELLPLLAHFDRVLVQHDRISTVAICLRDRTRGAAPLPEVPHDQLLQIGRALRPYCHRVHGVQLTAGIEVWEVADTLGDVEHLRELRPSGGKRAGVHLGAWSIGLDDEQLWSSLPMGGRLALREAIEQQLFAVSGGESPRLPPAAPLRLERAKRPWLSWGIALLLALIFGGQLYLVDGSLGTVSLHALGGIHGPSVAAGGWWRLFSGPLLHGAPVHLVANMAVLVLGGAAIEALLGRSWLLALLFACGLGGAVASSVWNPPFVVSVGASGAAVGLLFAGLLVSRHLPPGAVRGQLSFLLLLYGVPSLLPFLASGGLRVDYAAHFGGAATGALVGLLLLRTWPRAAPTPPFSGAARWAAAIGVAATCIACVVAWAPFLE